MKQGKLSMHFPGGLQEGILMIDGHVVRYDQWYQILPMLNHELSYTVTNGFAVIQPL